MKDQKKWLLSLLSVDSFKLYLDLQKYCITIILKCNKIKFVKPIYSMLQDIISVNITLNYNIDCNTWFYLKLYSCKNLSNTTWKEE